MPEHTESQEEEQSTQEIVMTEAVPEGAPEEQTEEATQPMNEATENTEQHIYSWKVNLQEPQTKVCSEIFELADGYKWRLLYFPRGNNYEGFISCYLEAADHPSLPVGWQREVHFCLTVVNHKDPSTSISHEVTNIFNSKSVDWGFSQLASIAKLRNPENGFLEQNQITITAEAKVLSNNHPLFSHGFNFLTYDSKKETGCVGLKNQGATCYMNSLLQSLFHISSFRKSVYSMPTDLDDQNQTSSIALAMQRIFYKLQFGGKSVGTKELTKAFGWGARDAFTQHDVQELNRVLCDTLEGKMKGTPAEGTIEKLFRGKTTSFIRCINIDYESKRTEDYYDLSLNVKFCKNVYDSFEQYIEVEELKGDNQYFAEGHGLQDAKKGCKFESFPPILQLQLKRFEYDAYRDANVKLNDRYAFPPTLDLRKYLDDAAEGEKAVYDLHGVLVHSGDVYGGHYYAFIRPTSDPQWLKFDDERVYKVSEKEAIDDNYGGEDVFTYQLHGQVHKSKHKKFANAYMLVYIRKDDQSELLAPIPENLIPSHLQRRFEEELKASEDKKREAAEAHLYTTIRVATEANIRQHTAENFDLFDVETLKPFKVLKSSTPKDFKAKAEEAFGIPVRKQRFWPIIRRRNRTSRPDKVWTQQDEEKNFENLKPNSEHKFFIEESRIPDVKEDGTHDVFFEPVGPSDCLLFFKFYDQETQKLEYVGHRVVSNQIYPEELEKVLKEIKNLPSDTPLNVYEEIKPAMIDKLKYDGTLNDGEITNGDIIVFEIKKPGNFALPTAKSYYDYVNQRLKVQFRKLENPKETVFVLELSTKMDYDLVAQRVGEKLGWEPEKLRFTGHHMALEQPKTTPLSRLGSTTHSPISLSEMLYYYPSGNIDILYFEQLDISLQELESKIKVKIAWQDAKTELHPHDIWASKDATVGDVVKQLFQLVKYEPEHPVHVNRVLNGRILSEISLAQRISALQSTEKLRVEEYTAEEETMRDDDRLTQVAHFSPEIPIAHFFGNPFHLVVKAEDTVGDVKARLKAKLGIKDEFWEKWKFGIFAYPQGKAAYPNDDELLVQHLNGTHSFIGLEHPDLSLRKHRRPEKALVIHGDK